MNENGELFARLPKMETPYLILDLDQVRRNLHIVHDAFGLLKPAIFYSCKANAQPELLALLYQEGCGFDVASINEILRLEEAGIPASSAVFSATVKVPSHIAAAFERGVDTFAVDSHGEIDKLHAHAPGAKVVVRLEVPSEGSRWPLTGKFGVPPIEAVEILQYARERGLQPHGITFHVGSQCERTERWRDAIQICSNVWRTARDAGMHLRLVNLGGGLPAKYNNDVPSVAEIGSAVTIGAFTAFGSEVEYALEPGRYIVADAGTLVTTVIGKSMRNGKLWITVDLSIYAGLLEVIGGWSYPIVTEKDHFPKWTATLAGPTCDSTDIIAENVLLPDLDVGDRLVLLSAGAYTTAYSAYNGFSFPQVMTVNVRAMAREAA